MSIYALRACVTIRLQARFGEWVLLDDLVTHLGCQVERVRNVCQQLVADGLALHATRDGRELYGIGVEGTQP